MKEMIILEIFFFTLWAEWKTNMVSLFPFRTARQNLFKIWREILGFACLLFIILFYERQLNNIENRNLNMKKKMIYFVCVWV